LIVFGRRAEKREALLAEFDRSGMTAAQFARFSGVRYPTLMTWLQKRRKETGQMASAKQDHPGWLEARVQAGIPNSENIVREPGKGGFSGRARPRSFGC
jgi:hypothetical protein